MFNSYLINHQKEWWRFLTSGFIHADWMHLLVNMLVLYSFGQNVESEYYINFEDKAMYYYLVLYIGAIIIANAPSYAKYKNYPGFNSLGASGAVSAIVFAAILFNPWSKIYLFGVIGIPGIIFGPLYLIYEYQSGKKQHDSINHDAHFGGAIFGLLFTIALKPVIALNFLNQLLQYNL